ncbi:hypothetical protein [Bartonella queenslandensis]|uniref:hypothetical protein n=1 Tax=Bartonella queenslandensis TaxID=481138 RepID=UPI0012E9AD0A|nr:hypothetical protein [Bartonella queenslandensis]
MKLATNEEIINSLFAKEAKIFNWHLPEDTKNFYKHMKDSLMSDGNLQQKILAALIRRWAMPLTPDASNPLNMFFNKVFLLGGSKERELLIPLRVGIGYLLKVERAVSHLK